MNKLTILFLLSALLVSCSLEMEERDPLPPAPVLRPIRTVSTPSPIIRPIIKAPKSTPSSGSIAAYLTPTQDTKLPTPSQLADGQGSSLGAGGSRISTPGPQPSTSIKPPSPSAPTAGPNIQEDDLAPKE